MTASSQDLQLGLLPFVHESYACHVSMALHYLERSARLEWELGEARRHVAQARRILDVLDKLDVERPADADMAKGKAAVALLNRTAWPHPHET